MKLLGYTRRNTTWVGALLSHDRVAPLGDVESFWIDPYTAMEAGLRQETLDLESLDLVPPVRPGARVLCIGLNYLDHVDEGVFNTEEHPTIFGRWVPSLAASGTPVSVPVDEEGLDWEAELAVFVGRPLSLATPEEALDAVFGYAAFNDLTARRAQKLTTQWTLGKNVDNSGQMSPMVTADEVGDPSRGWRIRTRVNGEKVQDADTSQMIFSVGEILAFLSRTFVVNPGDVVATGTPSGVGYVRNPPWLLKPGDIVEVDIEKVGTVRTPVAAWRDA